MMVRFMAFLRSCMRPLVTRCITQVLTHPDGHRSRLAVTHRTLPTNETANRIAPSMAVLGGASAWSRPSSAGGGKKNRRVMTKGAPTEAAGRKPRCPGASTRTRFGGRLVSALHRTAAGPARTRHPAVTGGAYTTPSLEARPSRMPANAYSARLVPDERPSPARADDRTLSSRPASVRPRRRSSWWPRVPSPPGGMRDSARALVTRRL